MMDTKLNREINKMVNSLETITYYKHHYVRKAGLKRAIKDLVNPPTPREEVSNE